MPRMPKRRRVEPGAAVEDATPRRTRARRDAEEEESVVVAIPSAATETPSKRRSILRGTPSKTNGTAEVEFTPKSSRKVLFSTPTRVGRGTDEAEELTPTVIRNDRSARKRSLRTLQRPIAEEDDSDDDDAAQNEAIAQRILGAEVSDEDDEIELADPSSVPDTPSKTGRPRGRPRGRRRERTPSPPPDLPPHERYFFQNRAGGNKTSTNTLPSHLLLGHDDYLTQIRAYKDPHIADMERLKRLHTRAFDQWAFELAEGFNICLYGYGSKRELAMEFAERIHHQRPKKSPIVVVNGYAPGLTVRDVLSSLAGAVLPKSTKLAAQPTAMLEQLLASLSDPPPVAPVTLIIHSLDHVNLRKATTPSIIARLAAHPSISLLGTCDMPNFPLLWEANLTRQLRFLYHDATTFQPYGAELDVVEEVNALLGRGRRRLGGKDGVGYVLKSLPENARALFRILVAEQLAVADAEPVITAGTRGNDDDNMGLDPDDILGAEDEDEAAAAQNTPSRRSRGNTGKKKTPIKPARPVALPAPEGVEYRTLYHKAVEEFVCSSELNFRTLLKEFHDHQMVESKKNAAGGERLVVPFRREELEGILEELV